MSSTIFLVIVITILLILLVGFIWKLFQYRSWIEGFEINSGARRPNGGSNITGFLTRGKRYKRGPHVIDIVPLEKFDPIFIPGIYGPTLETEVRFLYRGDFEVEGGATDLESWILAVLAKSRKNIFEFGTCTGKSTYLFAANTPPDAHIGTLTLAPDEISHYRQSDADSDFAHKHAIKESGFDKFLYSGTDVEHKITQYFGDSKQFDETDHLNKYDLIFIDGSHAYSYVESDTQKAMRMIKPGGIIFWHDYIHYHALGDPTGDVVQYLNNLAKQMPLFHLRNTSLVAFKSQNISSPTQL